MQWTVPFMTLHTKASLEETRTVYSKTGNFILNWGALFLWPMMSRGKGLCYALLRMEQRSCRSAGDWASAIGSRATFGTGRHHGQTIASPLRPERISSSSHPRSCVQIRGRSSCELRALRASVVKYFVVQHDTT